MILAHTGEELPPSSSMTRRMWMSSSRGTMRSRYWWDGTTPDYKTCKQSVSYLGIPPTTSLYTARYIADAEQLAGVRWHDRQPSRLPPRIEATPEAIAQAFFRLPADHQWETIVGCGDHWSLAEMSGEVMPCFLHAIMITRSRNAGGK